MRAIGIVTALLLAACGDDGGSGNNSDTPRGFCISETNRYRAMTGRPQVAWSEQLEDYADSGAMIDHAGSPHEHFSSTQGGGIAFAENECPRWNLQQQGNGDLKALVGACVLAFYSEGPGTGPAHGHYNNMMGNYGTLGCGIYENAGSVTIVQDFGR